MKKTVLITGGSGGLGYKISCHFAKSNYRILWVSWSETEIIEAKQKLISYMQNVEIEHFIADLSQDQGSQNIYNWVIENKWTIDVLINNAGFGSFGFFHQSDIEKEKKMIQLNVFNLFQLTYLFLPEMISLNKGVIINISSNSSFIPLPKMLIYSATKAFVTHFSKGLREEMKLLNSNVRIMTICPAAIYDTNFKISGKMEQIKTFKGLATTTSDEVANDIWKAFLGKNDFVVSGKRMRFLYQFYSLIPYRILQYIAQMELKEA